uniref:Uncharacterized protein n=1 Tax=Rhizophora mucronata TaxID=61149 RepID=A0A2P2Q3N1_RHIMU
MSNFFPLTPFLNSKRFTMWPKHPGTGLSIFCAFLFGSPFMSNCGGSSNTNRSFNIFSQDTSQSRAIPVALLVTKRHPLSQI